MPETYDLHEARQLQERVAYSAADALFVQSLAVPAGKIWTVLNGLYVPSVAETRTVFWSMVTAAGVIYPIQIPMSIALTASRPLPPFTEGNEYRLYPTDRLRVDRDVATAGSTMTLYMRIIETDLPFYAYDEPLKRVVKTKMAHGSVYRSTGGISSAASGTNIGGDRGRGSRGGSEPI